jgi:hypothetical protein
MDDTTRGVGDERTRGIGEGPATNYAADEGRRTREIRAEIEQTREDMSETIDAIQEKLRPGNIVNEAKERVKSATTERVRQMADSAGETAQQAYEQTRQAAGDLVEGARSNAVPAAMIGVGVAWLLVERFRQNNRRADHRRWRSGSYRAPGYDESADYRRSTAVPLYGSRHEDEESDYGDAGYRARNAASGLSETAADLRERTMRTGRRARNQFQRLLHENPLMVGAAAVVVGAAIGMALPETERENEWLGETRDNVVDKAQDVARNAATRAQEAAGEVADKVVRGE